jgi:Macrocin-O-methyltransferase (TylF)
VNTDDLKYALTRLGASLSPDTLRKANAVLNYLETGRWLRACGYELPHRFSTREELYTHIGTNIASARVLYLEFGVWQGASMQYWSNLLRNPESKLHGFDSFEGLPENWLASHTKGVFSTQGQLPIFNDSRVRLFKGWFQDTLPTYSLPSHDILVVHMDADLYSSTIFVLETLKEAISPGTYVLFDEFADRHNELRAFDEFQRSSNARFSVVGATRALQQIAFQRI